MQLMETGASLCSSSGLRVSSPSASVDPWRTSSPNGWDVPAAPSRTYRPWLTRHSGCMPWPCVRGRRGLLDDGIAGLNQSLPKVTRRLAD
jgi:hypothetical protein